MGVSALELRRRVLMAQPHKERKTGGIVSFNTHVPQVLDVSVPLSPVQAGTGDPYPPGGGVNLVDVQDVSGIKSQTQIKAGISLPAGTYTISAYITNSGTAGAGLRVVNGSAAIKTIGYSTSETATRFSGQFTLESETENLKLAVVGNASGYDASVSRVQIEKGATAHDFAPYSNIRPISGHTGATVERCGKNIIKFPYYSPTRTVGGITFTIKDDYSLDISGTSTSTAVFYLFNENVPDNRFKFLKGQTVTLSASGFSDLPGGSKSVLQATLRDDETRSITHMRSINASTAGSKITFTLADNEYISDIFVRIPAGLTIDGEQNIKPIFEMGSSATDFTPYSGEEYPFTFPALGKNLIPDKKAISGSTIQLGTDVFSTMKGRSATLLPGTYTLSVNTFDDEPTNLYVAKVGVAEYLFRVLNAKSITFTISEKMDLRMWVYKAGYGNVGKGAITSFQLEEGSVPTSYEPFDNTIYGGRLEPAAGRLVVELAKHIVSLTDNTALSQSMNEDVYRIGLQLPDFLAPVDINDRLNLLCNIGKNALTIFGGAAKVADCSVYNWNGVCVFLIGVPSSENTVAKGKQWLVNNGCEVVRKLAEPLIVPLTPAEIRALMGENNVFADSGDVDVEFWTN